MNMKTILMCAAALMLVTTVGFAADSEGELLGGRRRMMRTTSKRMVSNKLRQCDFLLNKNFKRDAKFYLCLFSASWCPPCRREMPRIAQTYSEMLKNNPDIELIHFSRDQDDRRALDWAKEHNVEFPVVAPDGGNPLNLHTRGIPHLFILKQDGTLLEEGHPASLFTEEKLRELGLLKIDDGASIVDLSEYNMPPCLILKKDGSTLYPTRDIAAAVYRKNTYRFDKAIYVTSAGQCLHFQQWFKVVEMMGYDWYDQLVHVPYGTVSINGSKLATRTGNVILLKDLFAASIEKVRAIIEEKNPSLEEKDRTAEAIGVGAIIFYYLSNNRMKDINFVLEDALSFDGNTGPYVQYTYARTCSLLEKAGKGQRNYGTLTMDETESVLLKTLCRFEEQVLAAIRDYEPSVITRYILDVAAAFNRFYHNCSILSAEDENVRAFRINLVEATKIVLGNAFELICLQKTEKV